MMPRPTTTSAAATTSTKNTTTWPPMSLSIRAKVTNVRLTALSMSSTHMNITSGLRRTSRPTAPDVKRSGAEHEVPGGGDLQDGDHALTPGGISSAASSASHRSAATQRVVDDGSDRA